MTWVRIDDAAALHPKHFRAGVEAYGWWSGALGLCNRILSDGFIASRDLELVYPGTPRDRVLFLVEVLVRENLLHVVAPDQRASCESTHCRRFRARSEGYLLHDYLDYQPSREQTQEKRRAMSLLGRKGAIARHNGPSAAPDSLPSAPLSATPSATLSSLRAPSRPVPSQEATTGSAFYPRGETPTPRARRNPRAKPNPAHASAPTSTRSAPDPRPLAELLEGASAKHRQRAAERVAELKRADGPPPAANNAPF